MDFFHLVSVLMVLAAGFAYFNYRVLKMPNSIGLMLVSMLFSLAILALSYFFPTLNLPVFEEIKNLDFSNLLLESMLSFMLFAGAIHLKYSDLKSEKLSIFLYATVSVLISTFVVGFASYYLLNYFGIVLPLAHALLFGALISPTDPIAVLSILKKAGINKSLETKIAGESLFNDGVAVVIFITLLQLAKPGVDMSASEIAMLFATEAIGGLVLGVFIGFVGFRFIKSIDNYQVEVLITLAVVMGGYTLAHYLHVSGPLAMVAAGLITGNQAKERGMSPTTAEYIDKFWELIDEILNAFLFVLIGFELLSIKTSSLVISMSFVLLVLVLLTRYLSVWLPSQLIRFHEKISKRTLLILTWGGLRGGISIALALSLKPEYSKDILVTFTYVIVCFSILVQGLTIGKLAKSTRFGD